MSNTTNKKIANFLTESSSLHTILQKATYLQELDKTFKKLLDKDIAPHYCVANLRDNILVIQCKNAAWATRFKFLIPDLLKNLRQKANLPSLVSISIIIAKD